MMDDCDCWECELERQYGGLDKIPEWEILSHGGCSYCAMTGFEDYPNKQIPCRIHSNLGQRIDRVNRAIIEGLRHPYTPEDGNCPYCLAEGKSIGVDCEHWVGVGWTKAGRTEELTVRLKAMNEQGCGGLRN